MSSEILAGLLLLYILYAGYINARDAWVSVTNPAIGWSAYQWNAENIRIDASSVDEYLIDHVGESEPVVRSFFDIYFDDNDNALIYVKSPCDKVEDANPRFFLHVVPVDRVNLPGIRKQYGNENFDFYFELQNGVILDRKCLAVAPLPKYDILYISTGQHWLDNTRRSWQVKFDLDK